MTDALDLAEIGRLARAAGGAAAIWEVTGWPSGNDDIGYGPDEHFVTDQNRHMVAYDVPSAEWRAHIARMDPATTLRLLELIKSEAQAAYQTGAEEGHASALATFESVLAEKDAEIERLKAAVETA